VQITRSVRIARPVEDVFAFVADARNDPQWCGKVRSVEQVEGDGPGPGARYAVVHRPVPLRPERRMDFTCMAWDPPRAIRWREDDGHDVIEVTYELAPDGDGATTLTQRDDATLGAPRLLQPLMARGIGHDVAKQLETLKSLLEAR
jgi:uncharacterized protein YndB with AHSA1/START domain